MTADETPQPGDHGGGASSVADEAARLAQAFSLCAARSGRGAEVEEGGPEPGEPAGAPDCGCTHGDSVEVVCRMCPVCRAAGLLQAVQPELLDRAADLLAMVVGGLRVAAEQRRSDEVPPADPGRGDAD